MKICLTALLAATVGLLLSELGFKGKRAYSAVAAVVLISFAGEGLAELLRGACGFSDYLGVSEVASAALKVLGCGYIFGMCSDLCTDLGESGLGRVLALAGRVEILLIVFPYFEDTISLGLELLR